MDEFVGVFSDRDGTLIVDVPQNTNPARVRPMPHAREALDRLRGAGVPIAVVTNQSAIAHGTVRADDVDAINAAAEAILGPLGPIFICPHDERSGCACRKPAPGMLLSAARALGLGIDACVMIGDIGSDIDAARAAGARSILVANAATRREEIAAAPCVAADLAEAVELVLSGAV